MSPQYLFCAVPYNLADIPLGTLVVDPRKPIQDAMIALEAKKDVDYVVRDQQDFTSSLESSDSNTFTAQITKLLTLARSKSKLATLEVSAQVGYLYELRSPKKFFRLMCAETKVRTWLEEGVKQSDDAYFVVGLRTFLDASVGESKHEQSTLSGKGAAPVGEVVKANTGADIKDSADVALEVESTHTQDRREAFRTVGERIFAVCYRRVKMSKRTTASSAELEKSNIWKLFTEQREKGSGNDENGELYEADLDGDDTTENDDEAPSWQVQSMKGTHLMCKSADAEFFTTKSGDEAAAI